MSEIMLALDSKNFGRLKRLDRTTVGKFAGVKILANETYATGEGSARRRYPAVGRYARVMGARAVMLDTRFSYDKPEEVVESTKAAIGEMRSFDRKTARHALYSRKPEFVTIHHDVPQDTIRDFAATAQELGVTPVCHLTSSRFSERDFELRGRSALDSAKYLAEFITKEDSTIQSVICAAVDAEAIKEVNPNLTVFATGGLLSSSESTTHERSALLADTAPFVDVFIMGGAILWADDPERAAKERFELLAA